MLRTAFAFAIAIAGLIFVGGSATVRAAPMLPHPPLQPPASIMWWTCSGGDAAGVTAGGACTVAVVDGVVTAGVTAGATGTAAGNLNFLRSATRTSMG
jgi:hypothetical protein